MIACKTIECRGNMFLTFESLITFERTSYCSNMTNTSIHIRGCKFVRPKGNLLGSQTKEMRQNTAVLKNGSL